MVVSRSARILRRILAPAWSASARRAPREKLSGEPGCRLWGAEDISRAWKASSRRPTTSGACVLACASGCCPLALLTNFWTQPQQSRAPSAT